MTRLLSTAGLLEKRVVAFRELHVGLDERKLLTGEVAKFFFKMKVKLDVPRKCQ